MENELKKKYGLGTAISMVVGIVIGSGVFFKAEKIITETGGNLWIGVIAWLVGGAIMLVCAYTFGILATRYENVKGGAVDYAEIMVGPNYAYYLGWFISLIYYPTFAASLSWLTSRYFCALIGWDIKGAQAMLLAGFILMLSYAVNALAPILAGKIQVATTIIKLIPLLLMSVFGLMMGLISGTTIENFTTVVNTNLGSNAYLLFAAIVATSFAYEGWIAATSINAEIKDAKRNLPKALVLGAVICIIVYVLYYIGITGTMRTSVLISYGEHGTVSAFSKVFSQLGGSLLMVFIVISCFGALNGIMMGCTRALYTLAVRNQGPKPKIFKEISAHTNMPTNSAIFGLMISMFWMLYLYGSDLSPVSWFNGFSFDITELPIITTYSFYIPIFIMVCKKERDLPAFKRFVIPILAIAACCFMIFSAFYAHRLKAVWYLITFAFIMLIGALTKESGKKFLFKNKGRGEGNE